MRAAQRLVLLAGMLLASPAGAAELRIPPLEPAPTKASFPWGRAAPPSTPDSISPKLPSRSAKPALVPPPATNMVREAPAPALVPEPVEPETSSKEPGQPNTAPTWLERFGPFLRSQLDMIVTGSITPPASRCDFGKQRSNQSPGARCGQPQRKRGKAAKHTAAPLTVAPLH